MPSSDGMIRCPCAGCGKRLKFRHKAAGGGAKCPRCGNLFRVPGTAKFPASEALSRSASEESAVAGRGEPEPTLDADHEHDGTAMARFLTFQGVVVIKEQQAVGAVECDSARTLKAAAVILATIKSGDESPRKCFGIKLEMMNSDGNGNAAFLDFDESGEFANAIAFIHEQTQRMLVNKSREGEADVRRTEHTQCEVSFLSKDHIRIGCSQVEDQKPIAFVRLGNQAETCSLCASALPAVKNLIEAARERLIAKGADAGRA